MTNKKFNFTELGKNTMPVYLGHGYIILILKTVMPEFNLLTLILPIFIVLILSHPKVSIFYTKFINFVNFKIFRLKPYK
jgi:fucose 4-O-acetylase-like acetyltransferase